MAVARTGQPEQHLLQHLQSVQLSVEVHGGSGLRGVATQDITDFYADIQNGTLPAVSFLKPSSLLDGHPASSKLNLFEAFTKDVLTQLRTQPDLWNTTAVFITVDEGGGYWDSGYIQPLDFFGDGTRIPLIIVSPWTTGGHVNHSYADHVSILKFIEKNWNLPTITSRSRDNLPNPQQNGYRGHQQSGDQRPDGFVQLRVVQLKSSPPPHASRSA